LGFKKERIKGGEKIKRKNLFSGDFDVLASSRRLCGGVSPHANSLIVAKKQQEKKTPAHPINCLCARTSTPSAYPFPALRANLFPV